MEPDSICVLWQQTQSGIIKTLCYHTALNFAFNLLNLIIAMELDVSQDNPTPIAKLSACYHAYSPVQNNWYC
jgi:hypothetical protein